MQKNSPSVGGKVGISLSTSSPTYPAFLSRANEFGSPRFVIALKQLCDISPRDGDEVQLSAKVSDHLASVGHMCVVLLVQPA